MSYITPVQEYSTLIHILNAECSHNNFVLPVT